jgi:hypothetical protein
MQIAALTDCQSLPVADKIGRLQAELSKLPQYEPVTRHYFADGMYCREVYRDAGVLVVGRVHKKEHLYVIASGSVQITTDDGVQLVQGPRVLVCKPGTKRAVYALTPTTCMTFHRTEQTDMEAIERELIEDDPGSMYGPGNVPKLREIER